MLRQDSCIKNDNTYLKNPLLHLKYDQELDSGESSFQDYPMSIGSTMGSWDETEQVEIFFMIGL